MLKRYEPPGKNNATWYLLHSPSPYRLWFDLGAGVKNLIDGNRLDCQGLLYKAEEEFATAL
jgi:hypothetical protein